MTAQEPAQEPARKNETEQIEPTELETRLVMVDGRDALAYVIIRPSDVGGVVVEAQAVRISKAQAAHVMRELAKKWDPTGE